MFICENKSKASSVLGTCRETVWSPMLPLFPQQYFEALSEHQCSLHTMTHKPHRLAHLGTPTRGWKIMWSDGCLLMWLPYPQFPPTSAPCRHETIPYCILSKRAVPQRHPSISWSTGICNSVHKFRQLIKFPFYPVPVFFSAFRNRSASESKKWYLNISEHHLHANLLDN